ncbi:MocE [Mesorhizobium sp. LNJC380A00]|nr:MocE [Mesorhizobium sp. LNJC380A00]
MDDISKEDVICFDPRGRSFAVCRSPNDEFFATDGYCTHEKAHAAEGLVIDDVIECLEAYWPLQLRPARPRARRVCVNLAIYPVRIEAGKVMLQI